MLGSGFDRRGMARIAAAGVLLATMVGAAPAPVEADLIIRGGTVFTGDAAPFTGDVAIAGDRIVEVGPHIKLAAKRTIDAKGMIVAPGFIDPHTHAKALASDDARERLVLPFLMQGVTTAFIGNDGGGSPDVAATLAWPKTKPVGINYATFVGFGAVRETVIGEARRAPTDTELQKMKDLVASAMCQGAIGFSTGLFYAPQSFSTTKEVVELAREAAVRGGIYDSHIRDESSYTVGLEAAVDEAITIGREAGMPVHISHIKALGVDVQGKAPVIIAKVEAARRAGQQVTANQYPWSASGTSLVASLVPLWAQDGGRPALLQRFDDASLKDRLLQDMAENLRKRGGADMLLITDGPEKGHRLSQVAARMKLDPVAAAIAIIRMKDPAVASFNQSEADIAAFMRQPWVMTGSDASTGHPRVYGSFARKYAKYVQQDHVITLRAFIERSSALTADTFGLKGRGHLRAGAFADVVVFDPKTYRERATYEQPEQFAEGVRTVVVNGRIAVDNGRPTGVAAGRALAHVPPKGSCS
ncbi:amidohydrolase family protein [Sphingomonas cannabina]|uniref:N-acyl-D-amino-acid deacylase family protein n=1 Tax=Sphingomonas cannabina TaxID=2899123 RepID=UPI001F232E92|nr:amidohydrolase family protein [Sphingomonas cannabina]UIJ47171.1 amidohydrolase family protein [Sphingomonas cannabina]